MLGYAPIQLNDKKVLRVRKTCKAAEDYQWSFPIFFQNIFQLIQASFSSRLQNRLYYHFL